MSGAPLPAAIGRYRPIGILGIGAMGTVYRAQDPVIGREVAIKVVRTDTLEPEMRAEFVDRLRREVQAAGRCSHRNIVGVYDFLDDADHPYIVMELVEGRTLQAIMREPAARGELRIAELLTQVLDGLGTAHALGITHRDMKPANILVTSASIPKIADFGIARLSDSSVTQVGTMLGTPSYMSPEQVQDDRVDHRSDLFAVGCILYEYFAGTPPFAGRSLTDTIRRVTGPEPADMRPIEAAGGIAFIPLLERALAKVREQRLDNAPAFAAGLQAASDPAAAPPDPNATVILGAASPGGSLTRWSPDLLARVEQALAKHVGPMARVMVTRAARSSVSTEELLDTLARGLDTSDRVGFMRRVGERAEPTFGAPGTTMMQATQSAKATATAPVAAISPQAADAAQAALVVHVGPMARLMTRKAAAEAVSVPDFIERLCANVEKSEDSAALRRLLRTKLGAASR